MVSIKVGGSTIDGIELAIFDRDGTLIDIYHYWAWMVARRAEIICRKTGLDPAGKHRAGLMEAMGIDVAAKRIKPDGPVGIRKRDIVMRAAEDYLTSVGLSGKNRECEESFKETDEISRDNLDKIVKPLPGLYDMFAKLKQYGCKIAIATTDKTQRAEIVMKHLKIDGYIDATVGADAVKNPKPAPDMIEFITKKLLIPPDKCVMVGDATIDVEMGTNAKVKAAIGVASGISPRGELLKKTPYVADGIAALGIIGG